MGSLTHALELAIRRAGADGVRYTERQLFYEVCRALRPSPSPGTLVALVAAAAGALFAARRPGLAALTLLSAAVAAGVWLRGRRRPAGGLPLDAASFAAALAAYRSHHGQPPGLLPPPAPQAPLAGREPDLADYGLSRALVCQDAGLARMLIANMLHLEAECAIFALDEATPLPDAVVAMLMRSPDGQIFVLHDASAKGLALSARAAELLELPPGMQVRSLRERRWLLAGYHAELAAIQPAHLLRALRRAMRRGLRTARRRPTLRQIRNVGYMSWPER